MGETNLKVLLATMEPVLFPEPYGLAVWRGALPEGVFATVAEAEGLTAAFAGALGREGISCNVIAGVHHDHLFVQWDRREDAMAALWGLSRA